MHASLVDIRHASVLDAATIAAFAARQFAETFGPDNDPADMALYLDSAFSDSLQRSELEDPERVYLLAYQGDTLAGYALVRMGSENTHVTGAAPAEIQRFYVDRAHHGHGVAATLMAPCTHVAESRGARTLWLAVWERNARAIRFYEKIGFVDAGVHTFQLGNDLQHDRVMMRTLPQPF